MLIIYFRAGSSSRGSESPIILPSGRVRNGHRNGGEAGNEEQTQNTSREPGLWDEDTEQWCVSGFWAEWPGQAGRPLCLFEQWVGGHGTGVGRGLNSCRRDVQGLQEKTGVSGQSQVGSNLGRMNSKDGGRSRSTGEGRAPPGPGWAPFQPQACPYHSPLPATSTVFQSH